eukprot:scaffold183584_cov28-Tisochrysis_lutea.AAC.4
MEPGGGGRSDDLALVDVSELISSDDLWRVSVPASLVLCMPCESRRCGQSVLQLGAPPLLLR